MKNSFNRHAIGKKISLDYSRHLCDDSMTVLTKRPSRSFSDTAAIEFIRRRALQGSSDSHEKDPRFVNSASTERIYPQVFNKDQSFLNKYRDKNLRVEAHGLPETKRPGWTSSSDRNSVVNPASTERVCQQQVFNKDQSFLNKYGNKNLRVGTHGLPETKRPGNTSSSGKNSVVHAFTITSNDDETRSCCDSVSSIISSNFANPDGKGQRESKVNGLPDKKEKFDSITTWLESLPRPVL